MPDPVGDALRDAERRGWLCCKGGLGHEALSQARSAWTERCHRTRAVAVEAVVIGGAAFVRWWCPPGARLSPAALPQLARMFAGADRARTATLHPLNGYVAASADDVELLAAMTYDLIQEHVGPAAARRGAAR